MKCLFCGNEFEPDTKHPWQKFCSYKCSFRYRDGLYHLAKKNTLPDALVQWARKAAECNLDYGTYRALREQGKTFDELKASASSRSPPLHAHRQNTFTDRYK